MANKQVRIWKVTKLDSGKTKRKLTKTYTYSNKEELINVYEKLRKAYNVGITRYGRGRERYQIQNVGQKTYKHIEDQVKMMARRLGTGIYEQTGGEFKQAFISAINTHIETYGEYDSDEVFALALIFDKMHHTQFTSFYNSLSPTLRSTLFDTSNYYQSDGSNASSYAGRTIEELVKFAKNNPKVRQILEEVAEDYAIMI